VYPFFLVVYLVAGGWGDGVVRGRDGGSYVGKVYVCESRRARARSGSEDFCPGNRTSRVMAVDRKYHVLGGGHGADLRCILCLCIARQGQGFVLYEASLRRFARCADVGMGRCSRGARRQHASILPIALTG